MVFNDPIVTGKKIFHNVGDASARIAVRSGQHPDELGQDDTVVENLGIRACSAPR